jgi:thioredoxin 1
MKEIGEADFDRAIGNGTVLVDFSAAWCGPCKALTPVMERISNDYRERLHVYKVDIDEAQSVAARHGVMSVPTVVLYKDGRAVDRKVGSPRESDLREMIDSHIE